MKLRNFVKIFIVSIFCFARLFSQDPIASYSFNGNANDESGNGNNGFVYGASLTTDRFGNSDRAYSFNGVNNYIVTPLGNNTQSLAMSFWFKCKQKLDFPLTSNKFNIIGFSDNNNNVSDAIGAWDFNGNSNNVRLNGLTYTNAIPGHAFVGCNSVNVIISYIDTTWNHIVYMRSKDSISLYFNGVLQGSISYNGNYQIDNSLIIGKLWKIWDGNYFNGSIDDIRIYNRTLSGTEISALFYEDGKIDQSEIALNSKNINMGTVKIGKTKDAVITITNTGSANLIISLVASDNASFVVKTLTFNILPGETAKDTICFVPSFAGNSFGKIFLVSNALSSPDTISVTANGSLTNVKDLVEIPKEYTLSQNYPNPFNPTTTISYSIPKTGLVTVAIYDIQGQLVQTLSNSIQSAGKHSVQWNATESSSGVYICRVVFGNTALINKLTLIK
jgi:hypothetical protein